MVYHSTTVETLLKETGNHSCADYYGHQADDGYLLADLKLHRGIYLATRSEKYQGAKPFKHLKVIKRILQVMGSSIGNQCSYCNAGEICSWLGAIRDRWDVRSVDTWKEIPWRKNFWTEHYLYLIQYVFLTFKQTSMLHLLLNYGLQPTEQGPVVRRPMSA